MSGPRLSSTSTLMSSNFELDNNQHRRSFSITALQEEEEEEEEVRRGVNSICIM